MTLPDTFSNVSVLARCWHSVRLVVVPLQVLCLVLVFYLMLSDVAFTVQIARYFEQTTLIHFQLTTSCKIYVT